MSYFATSSTIVWWNFYKQFIDFQVPSQNIVFAQNTTVSYDGDDKTEAMDLSYPRAEQHETQSYKLWLI